MPRHVGTKIFHHPLRHLFKLHLRIIQARDEQSGYFKPDLRLALHIDERIQDRLQMRVADLVIELVGKALQVNIGRVHVAVELGPRFRTDITGRHRDALDTARMTRDCGIDGVFVENRRIIVSVGNARTSEPLRHPRNVLGISALGEHVVFARLADVPVLAEFAAQIAAAGPERQHWRPRQEVVERFFLDRVDAEATGAAIGRQHQIWSPAAPARSRRRADPAMVSLSRCSPVQTQRACPSLHPSGM
ncbi:hypothetical protein GALL_422650 [mine drainage metagenome]|uniref:Uncharacterized protein n=1 Tax=mine drainage metagenome TaxID=410659 RepID=A0A1J5Q7S7_9ZZZZ